METIRIQEGVDLHLHLSKKYKTVSYALSFLSHLERKERAAKLVLSIMLNDSCAKWKEKQDIQKVLDEMYGASYGCVEKPKGNRDMMLFTVSAPCASYIPEDLTSRTMNVLVQFALHPYMENGIFREENLAEAKQKAVDLITSSLEQPDVYAAFSAAKLAGGNMAQRALPDLSEIEKLTVRDVSTCYEKMIREAGVDLFVLGDVHKETVIQSANQLLDLKPRHTLHGLEELHSVNLCEKNETRRISQSYLVQMYETGLLYTDERMPAFMIGNGILGGTSSSLLFQELREKRSLCYSAGSENMIYDGALRITTAMEKENLKEAEELIAMCIRKVQNQEYSDRLLETTRSMYINSWRSSQDIAGNLIWDDCRAVLLERKMDVEIMIEKMRRVKKEDISLAFAHVEKKTVFRLLQEETE